MIIESPSQLTDALARANDESLRLEVPATQRRYLLVDTPTSAEP